MCNTQHAACTTQHSPRATLHAPRTTHRTGWAASPASLRTDSHAAKKRRTIGEADLDERCVAYLQSVSGEVAAIGACLLVGL